jgi:hypothetical protein
MILFTLMMPAVIVPLVGLAIDATMCRIVQAKLGVAVDGAALGTGRLLGTNANFQELADEFVRANFRADGTAGFWRANTLTTNVTYTSGFTKTIVVNAQVRVPLFFARVFRQDYAVVSASATAQRTDSRIMMVIDRSTSMSGTAISQVISSARSFTQSFTNGTDELGLVVYGGSAIVAYPPTRPWTATISSTNGGPDSNFNDGTTNSMVTQLGYIHAGSYTGTAEALSLAYIELQKAHLRDLAANGTDDKLNSIVLFTDGAPTALSLYLNDPSDNAIRSTSLCTYKAPTAPVPVSNQMRGWIGNYGGFATQGFNRMSSTDTDASKTVKVYLQNPNYDELPPYVTTPETNCTGLTNVALGSSLLTDLSEIPQHDLYGNSTRYGHTPGDAAYTNSHFVDSSGATVVPNPVYDGTIPAFGTSSAAANGYNWGIAAWDATDNAAYRIRTDANLTNRTGDTQNMNIAIYAIGYLGSGGLDDGLLKRVANDKSSSSYDATQPTGMYIPASNTTAMAQAFQTVASQILRLTK